MQSSIRREARPPVRAAIWHFASAVVLALSFGCSGNESGIEAPSQALAEGDRPPNFLIVLADDLGYADIGAMGSEIATPNLDALAHDGQLFTAMYASALPISRANLMTGLDHHIVGYGSMGPAAGAQLGRPGYERHLNDRARTAAEWMRDAGYRTIMVGTWGLGLEPQYGPDRRGFEHSFALIEAAVDYFLPDPARLSATETITFREDGAEVSQPDRYLTDVFTDKMIAYLDMVSGGDAPFFAYISYTAPHFPLQAPAESIDRNRGRYDNGYDEIRLARISRQKSLGVIAEDFVPAAPVPESSGYKRWGSLTPEEQRVESHRMEIYAAMVENLDSSIGRLVEHLKQSGEYENTLILFASGNGAAGDWKTRRAPEDVDNSYANMGRRHSWLAYTERWAEVSNAPLSMWKTRMTEGGISVPAIIRLPNSDGAGRLVRTPATFEDILPTLLDLAEVPPQNDVEQLRQGLPAAGTSLLPLLRGQVSAVHPDDAVFADELNGEAYVRQGRWKAVLLAYADPDSDLHRQELAALAVGDLVSASQIRSRFPRVWRLYDIEADRGETTDRSETYPDVLDTLRRHYSEYRTRVGVVDP